MSLSTENKSITSSNHSCSSNGDRNISIYHAGEIIGKKYILIEEIGSGSYSTVWLSYNFKNKIFYAIKIQSPDEYESGLDEIELLKNLNDNKCKYLNKLKDNFIHIKTIYDNSVEDQIKSVCMVFDLMVGSIYDIMDNGKYTNGLPILCVKKIIYQLLYAMDILYNKYNIIHADIKPDNILLVGHSHKINLTIESFKNQDVEHLYASQFDDFKPSQTLYNSSLDKIDFDKLYLASLRAINNINKNNNTDIKTNSDSDTNSNSDSDNESDNESDSDDSDDSDDSNSNSDSNNDSDSDTNNSDNESENNNYELFDDKYIDLKNLIIKLSDFGGSLKKEDLHHEIQTRYYRSPEVILYGEINYKCDMWSVGCVIYELLTGRMLFDPNKTKKMTRDRSHLAEFQKILGDIPEYLLNKCEKRKLFLKNNNLLKGLDKISYKSLSTKLIKHMNPNFNISDKQLNQTLSLIYKLLNYNHNLRPSPKECMNDEWFNDIK